jgi:hypothetical protein
VAEIIVTAADDPSFGALFRDTLLRERRAGVLDVLDAGSGSPPYDGGLNQHGRPTGDAVRRDGVLLANVLARSFGSAI